MEPSPAYAFGTAPPAGCKGALPFRLGSTSFIFPADVVPNVEALAEHVDDVEILCFESDETSPLPTVATLDRLRDIARQHEVSYTVHLPLDADIGSLEPVQRSASVGKVLRVIRHMMVLQPFAFVLHCPITGDPIEHWERAGSAWREAVAQSLDELLAAGVDPSRLCVETLDYPIPWIADLLTERGIQLCLDVGHLLLHGLPLEPILEQYASCIRVVHLHGVKDGRDHIATSNIDRETREMLCTELLREGAPTRVVTLELFNEEALLESMTDLSRWLL